MLYAPPGEEEAIAGLIARVDEWAGGIPGDGLSETERELLGRARQSHVDSSCPDLRQGPEVEPGLTAALADLRPVETRRTLGQFFTPEPVVETMVRWVVGARPGHVVDTGCGTGRFAVAAARALPDARVVAVDLDPAATLITRAKTKRLGLTNINVRCMDFLRGRLDLDDGPAAFLGNPPYVRHHRLPPGIKAWGAGAAKRLNLPFSRLAGLHVYFFLATALRARPGDVGCFITSAEWLDVGYGKVLRELLRDHLGLTSISLLHESAEAFDDAMTTAAVTCFKVGSDDSPVLVSRVSDFKAADGADDARPVPRCHLVGRWGNLIRNGRRREDGRRRGWVRLGDVASVHRGIATGANDFFVMDPARAKRLGLAPCAHPVVTSARQILDADGRLDASACRVLLILPRDLSILPARVQDAARRYLAEGEERGIDGRYLCRHRRPWWWLGEVAPPPIVASYMARRPPAFALNPDGALILNIAHGVYPRRRLSADKVRALVSALNEAAHTFVGNGRLYQGGLEKFEPREMEDLLIPPPAELDT
jgi:SAM-dependent methyltransferase